MPESVDCAKSAGIAREFERGVAPGRPARQQWRARPLSGASAQELVDMLLGRRASAALGIDENWLAQHARAAVPELAAQMGIPWRAALRMASAFELGRRAAALAPPRRAPIRSPRDAFEILRGPLAGRDRETVLALYLDGRHRVLQLHEVSIGTATASLIHPREVFGPALRVRACAVVVAHNHPSGDPEPSVEDRGVTERLQAAGELVGVPLLDHLVVGGETFVSLRGRGAWAQPRPLLA